MKGRKSTLLKNNKMDLKNLRTTIGGGGGASGGPANLPP
jgi:hypothetical protein